jgi:glucose uptake protein GlcU
MLIVLFIIFLIMIGIGITMQILEEEKNRHRNSWEETYWGLITCILGGIIELIVVISIIFNAVNISKLKVSDQKITMYENENNNIQNSISEIVKNYMNYEQNTYAESLKNIDISNTDIVILTQLYPDLKSNEMVNTQIQIYQENNTKIKELKEQKLDYQV